MRFTSLFTAVFVVAGPCALLGACVGDDPVTTTGDRPDGAILGVPEGGGSDAPAADSATDGGDAGGEAGKTSCHLEDAFDAPVLLGSVNASGFIDRGARLSPDETTMYFASTRDGKDRTYFAVRQTPASAFLAPTILLQDGQDNDNPSVTADGKTLFVNRTSTLTAGAENVHIYTRSDPTGIFSNDALVNGVSGPSGSKQPYVVPDGSALYFSTAGVLRTSTKVGSAFAAPTDVIPTPSGVGYTHPVVTDDELGLWLSSDAGVLFTSRKSRSDSFGTPAVVPELSAKLPARPTWISPDRCSMYLTIGHVITAPGVTGETHIFRATRKPR